MSGVRRIELVESWMGACGKVRKWKWSGGMAFIWWRVETLVIVAKDAGRE